MLNHPASVADPLTVNREDLALAPARFQPEGLTYLPLGQTAGEKQISRVGDHMGDEGIVVDRVEALPGDTQCKGARDQSEVIGVKRSGGIGCWICIGRLTHGWAFQFSYDGRTSSTVTRDTSIVSVLN